MRAALLLTLALGPAAPVALAQPRPMPPVAPQRPHTHTHFGVGRDDPYYWLRDRDDPEVLRYLEAENAHTAAETAALKPLEDALFAEIVGRIKQDDATAPVFDRGFFYYARYEEGKEYPIYARRRGSMEAPEEVLIDGNARAAGHDFYSVGAYEVSDDGRLLAWAEDTVGRRIYTVRFRDLTAGADLPDVLSPATPSLAWAADDRTLFFGRQDPETLRAYRVVRHTLGADPAADPVVFQEDDDEFSVDVGRSKSRRFVLASSDQTLTTEWRYLDAATPDAPFRVVRPRERGHEYAVEHAGDRWYVRTNERGAENFGLMTAPTDEPAAWAPLVPHRPEAYLEGFEVFAGALVTQEREGGLTRLRVRGTDGAPLHDLDFGEPTYTAALGTNPAYETTVLRYGYSSLTTPNSVYDYDLATRRKTLVKQDPVLGAFRPDDYAAERLLVPARDGTSVPVSLVYRRGTPRDGTAPLLLYAYGSYGYSMPASFSHARLSLLDRGFVYAIAHVRGGQEMGRAWYERGKLMQKMNTFTDFIDAGEHLVAERYADPRKLYAQGGSAGGLLMGAVVNLRPDLWAGVVANVPFVDVVTTMLDETIPLTTFEYDEWGNPNEEAAFRYMLAYSPYDNVAAKAYPPLLVTTGLHDSQVQYWEPAKWVARLRAMRTNDAPLLLKTNLEAGHGGASGRFQRYREVAFEYAWLLGLAGRAE